MKSKSLINSVLILFLPMCFVFGFSGCDKSEWEETSPHAEDPVFQTKQATKSLADVDTTLNASADDFIYFEPYSIERNCGCVPPIRVEIVTGVPVFWFPLGGSYECKEFSLEYTINGVTGTKEVVGTEMVITDVRIGYGQSCEGSVKLTCKSTDCAKYSGPCSRTVKFNLKEGEEVTTNPNSCGRYYEEVTVEVIRDGSAVVSVPEPSLDDNRMAPTCLDVKYGDRTVRSFNLEIGENEISYTTGVYNYQIRMYNPDLCSSPTNHFLECDLLGGPGLKTVREINNTH